MKALFALTFLTLAAIACELAVEPVEIRGTLCLAKDSVVSALDTTKTQICTDSVIVGTN